jgi:hypothetical protein
MRACTHTPRERASERGERERERERERTGERARESARTLFQVRPAHHIVSARQAYAHLPCFLRPGYPLPPRPSETLQRSPDADAPPPRPRRHRTHPSARHPRPPDPGPRTPPLGRRRVPARHRTVPRPRAWDARASTVIGATAARPRAPKPSRRKTTSGPAAGHRGHAQPPAPAAPAPRARPSRTPPPPIPWNPYSGPDLAKRDLNPIPAGVRTI